jgi:hypothetical protein
MIPADQETYIFREAKIPEHIPNLMVGISGGEPYLIEDYIYFAKGDWLIFVGYPFEKEFCGEHFAQTFLNAIKKYQPIRAWFIAPQIPESLKGQIHPGESDHYYQLHLQQQTIQRTLIRTAERTAENLAIDEACVFTQDHKTLTQEFLEREELPPRIRELYLRMPDYLGYSSTAFLLSARDKKGELAAYFVLELGAEKFITYVVGCFSRRNYVPHASDFLFWRMVQLAREKNKEYIHLGLGVNEGIRRFKRKWGGIPFLRYESGEWSKRPEGLVSWIAALQGKI